MNIKYDFAAGDTLSKLSIVFGDADGVVQDISGATVELRFRILLGGERTPGALVIRTMTVDDGPGGAASYDFTEHDLQEGVMRCEFVVTLADGRVGKSLEVVDFAVRGAL